MGRNVGRNKVLLISHHEELVLDGIEYDFVVYVHCGSCHLQAAVKKNCEVRIVKGKFLDEEIFKAMVAALSDLAVSEDCKILCYQGRISGEYEDLFLQMGFEEASDDVYYIAEGEKYFIYDLVKKGYVFPQEPDI